MVKGPIKLEAPAVTVMEPPESANAPVHWMLATVEFPVAKVTVTFVPARLMTASSPGPGTTPFNQLMGVFQSPPAALVQVMVAPVAEWGMATANPKIATERKRTEGKWFFISNTWLRVKVFARRFFRQNTYNFSTPLPGSPLRRTPISKLKKGFPRPI